MLSECLRIAPGLVLEVPNCTRGTFKIRGPLHALKNAGVDAFISATAPPPSLLRGRRPAEILERANSNLFFRSVFVIVH